MAESAQHNRQQRTDKPSLHAGQVRAGQTDQAHSLGAEVVQRAAHAPQALTPADVMALQRTVGNAAVQRILAGRARPGESRSSRPLVIQPKLTVGPVDDRYEREADRVAHQVVRSTATQEVQRLHHGREQEEAQPVQMKPLAAQITPLAQRHHDEGEEEHAQTKSLAQRQPAQHGRGCSCSSCTLQRKVDKAEVQRAAHGPSCSCSECSGVQRKAEEVAQDGSFAAGEDLAHRVKGLHGRGTPLPDTVRREMEPRFGADFSGVRVHTGPDAAQLNRTMGAQAFTHGTDITFAPGRYNPASTHGKYLLAHELTHTIQQTGARRLQRQSENHGNGCGCVACAGVAQRGEAQPETGSVVAQRSPGPDVVQRHSSWEHKALGDINPDQLVVLGVYEEMKEARKTAKKQAGLFRKPDPIR